MATHKETRMPPRRTRVVGTGPDNGYGYTGQYLAQYYDRDMNVWFDIGDPHDTEQAALAAAKASEERAAAKERPPIGRYVVLVWMHDHWGVTWWGDDQDGADKVGASAATKVGKVVVVDTADDRSYEDGFAACLNALELTGADTLEDAIDEAKDSWPDEPWPSDVEES